MQQQEQKYGAFKGEVTTRQQEQINDAFSGKVTTQQAEQKYGVFKGEVTTQQQEQVNDAFCGMVSTQQQEMKAKIAAAIEKDAKVAAFKQSLYDIVANPDDNVDLIIKDLDKHCMPRPGDVMVYKKDSTLRQTRA